MPTPTSIILDWGTSSLRAMLVSDTGETLDTKETSSGGIQFVKDGAFEAALMSVIGDWNQTEPTDIEAVFTETQASLAEDEQMPFVPEWSYSIRADYDLRKA